jgi:hypothetical protein
MKSTFSLLILVSSFATSSPIPSHMLEKNSLQLNLIFSKNNKVLQREVRIDRESREARECRFCLRKMPKTREIRIARINREGFVPTPIQKKGKKIATVQ